MTDDSLARQGHATLDLATRRLKGLKIERLLGLDRSKERRLLEVGTGAGGIAHYFGTSAESVYDVDAVDVTDNRQVVEGFRFTLVTTTTLPFPEHSFDVVVSNHVIEHVGDHTAQRHHLEEIRRVLKPGGRVYLAVPNRWMVVEPHFGLPFLSWLPRSMRTPYVRLARRGTYYDCEPLQVAQVEALTRQAGFQSTNASVRAFRLLVDIEGKRGWLFSLLARVPDRWLRRLEPIIPTHVYLMEKAT